MVDTVQMKVVWDGKKCTNCSFLNITQKQSVRASSAGNKSCSVTDSAQKTLKKFFRENLFSPRKNLDLSKFFFAFLARLGIQNFCLVFRIFSVHLGHFWAYLNLFRPFRAVFVHWVRKGPSRPPPNYDKHIKLK